MVFCGEKRREHVHISFLFLSFLPMLLHCYKITPCRYPHLSLLLSSRFPWSNVCENRPDRSVGCQVEEGGLSTSVSFGSTSRSMMASFQRYSSSLEVKDTNLRCPKRDRSPTSLCGAAPLYRFPSLQSAGAICLTRERLGLLPASPHLSLTSVEIVSQAPFSLVRISLNSPQKRPRYLTNPIE
ncbi:hypothetical protein GGS23DRAFT_472161 [Durotheca rogersii]|uniref:uncharacterized protein n=1 Tax=Durotheca rogersii TaxID=419775 RepID=UPI0022202169|nr:uncharacterized protein GGS23DRAFT_472161 [Durotheca rogersii]KAI5855017.1 hypothetical protein GGS23DRAFT_472161 [Durotheca rogersii]